MKLKKSFLIISVLLSTSLLSQSADSVKNEAPYSRKHKWALQFQAGYNFQIQAFNGLTVTLKYHFNEKSALRFGAGYFGQTNDGQIELNNVFEDNYYDEIDYQYQFNGVIDYIYYVNPFSRFSIFWGTGPSVKYNYGYDEYPVSNGDLIHIYKTKEWAVGLNAVLGAEWIPVSDFSVFAEYEAAGYYGKTRYLTAEVSKKGCTIEKYIRSTEKWEFIGNRALLGISVYFDKLF